MFNGKIDFRSDTVTVPTDKMRKAMYEAPVGDDVYGDDPTVNKLEELVAEKMGKEAGLYVVSGTMSNQLALFAHCQRGCEVILPDNCHVVQHEAAAAAFISGTQLRCILPLENGEMDLGLVEKTIRNDPENVHVPKTGLITYENADSDGKVRTLEYMAKVKALAEKYGLPVHLDGARIYNAAAALGVPVKEIAKYADTVSVCLSKGLCAPVGSVLVGSKAFINEARRKRKIMGGGMRQAGVIAAAGIVAIEDMTSRLIEDHENAKYMGKKLAEIPGCVVEQNDIQINMVFCDIKDYKLSPDELAEYLKEHGVIINAGVTDTVRFVTNYYVTKEDIDKTVELMKNA